MQAHSEFRNAYVNVELEGAFSIHPQVSQSVISSFLIDYLDHLLYNSRSFVGFFERKSNSFFIFLLFLSFDNVTIQGDYALVHFFEELMTTMRFWLYPIAPIE